MADSEKPISSFSDEEKAAIRKRCLEGISEREGAVKYSVDQVGGEDHLTERIDLLVWVYNDRAEIEKYRETIRFIDGEENVDWEKISWVLDTFRQRERLYRGIAENTRRIIEENIYNEDKLREETERANEWKTALDALTRETLKKQA